MITLKINKFITKLVGDYIYLSSSGYSATSAIIKNI